MGWKLTPAASMSLYGGRPPRAVVLLEPPSPVAHEAWAAYAEAVSADLREWCGSGPDPDADPCVNRLLRAAEAPSGGFSTTEMLLVGPLRAPPVEAGDGTWPALDVPRKNRLVAYAAYGPPVGTPFARPARVGARAVSARAARTMAETTGADGAEAPTPPGGSGLAVPAVDTSFVLVRGDAQWVLRRCCEVVARVMAAPGRYGLPRDVRAEAVVPAVVSGAVRALALEGRAYRMPDLWSHPVDGRFGVQAFRRRTSSDSHSGDV